VEDLERRLVNRKAELPLKLNRRQYPWQQGMRPKTRPTTMCGYLA
jgi:nuclear transport factor 2 (NTF2) superfamily protein